jgi:6-phosphogluconolactonase
MGKGPRDFMIDPQGKYLVLANQYTNNIHVFGINQSNGMLSGPLSTIQVGNPVCIKIVPAE